MSATSANWPCTASSPGAARTTTIFPRKGVFAAARGTYFPKLWDVTSDFGEVNGNVNAYLSAGTTLTLALRAGGKKVFGIYPYTEAASIGEGGLGAGALGEPQDTVRGYRARRYMGDSSAWGNAELRLRVSRISLILPGTWGINGFADVGRVWLKGESSDTWHAGVGGGIWLSLLNDCMAFSTGISHGKEENLYYLKGGSAIELRRPMKNMQTVGSTKRACLVSRRPP